MRGTKYIADIKYITDINQLQNIVSALPWLTHDREAVQKDFPILSVHAPCS